MRVEVAKQLVRVKLDQVYEGLVAGLNDADARVRRAVIHSVAKIKTRESYQAIQPFVEQGDPSYLVESADSVALGEIVAAHLDDPTLAEQGINLLKSVLEQRSGWNEVVRSGAIAGLSKMKTSEDALNLILKYTAPGVPQPLRLASIRALGSISTGQTPTNLDRILQRFEELANETFFLTQVAVVSALEQMETPKAMDVLEALAEQTLDGRVRRRAEEAVHSVQGKMGSEPALKKLREELDKIKKENQELRSRLETLEAKAK